MVDTKTSCGMNCYVMVNELSTEGRYQMVYLIMGTLS